MTAMTDTTEMTDEQYRAHRIDVLAVEAADEAWRAGLNDLIEREELEYSQLSLTPDDIAWLEGEEECKGLTQEELRQANETFRDRIAELHAGNEDYE